MNGLSLFANVGIGETFLEEVNLNIVVANELLEKRAEFYRHLYPKSGIITGDITNESIFDKVINLAIEKIVNF